jgi:hypothetical protein
MRHCFGFGQIIASEIPIPGARDLTDESEAAPGISISHDVSAVGESESPAGFSRDEDALRLTVPGMATYRCSASAIAVTLCSSAKPVEVGERLVAGALPASLWMQGRLLLHAAAVCARAGGPALGLLGRSGAGKSTLAAALVEGGARLLADDSIAIVPALGAMNASGLPGGLFLRDGPSTRRFRPLAADQTIDAARIGALIVLDDAVAESGLVRLSPRKALEALLAHRHRPNAPALLGLRPKALLDSIELARSIPIYTWRRQNAMLENANGANLLMRALIDETIEL